MPIDKRRKDEILKILTDRGAGRPCSRCDYGGFELVDGYFMQPIQPDIGGGIAIGGPAIPSIVVVCTRCGYMVQHALGVLGLLPKPEEKAGGR